MLGRFHFERVVENLEMAALVVGMAGSLVGGVYAPLAMLDQHSFSDGLVGVAEASVAVPISVLGGGAIGGFAGACFGLTLPVTVPVVAYHLATKHFERPKHGVTHIPWWRRVKE